MDHGLLMGETGLKLSILRVINLPAAVLMKVMFSRPWRLDQCYPDYSCASEVFGICASIDSLHRWVRRAGQNTQSLAVSLMLYFLV